MVLVTQLATALGMAWGNRLEMVSATAWETQLGKALGTVSASTLETE